MKYHEVPISEVSLDVELQLTSPLRDLNVLLKPMSCLLMSLLAYAISFNACI